MYIYTERRNPEVTRLSSNQCIKLSLKFVLQAYNIHRLLNKWLLIKAHRKCITDKGLTKVKYALK